MNAPANDGVARSRACYARFVDEARQASDLVTAIQRVAAPGCRVHIQNGEVATPEVLAEQTRIGLQAFPDLGVEFERALFPDERFVLQMLMRGSTSASVPFLPDGYPFLAHGCAIAHVDESHLIDELWVYVNPGFAFSFPRTGVEVDPPPPDGAGDEEAAALYREWIRRASEDGDLVQSIVSLLSPDGVVHLGNGDVGGPHILEDLFRRIHTGIPDVSIGIDDVIVVDGQVVVQFSMSGTHLGPLGVWPPTGNTLPSTGAFIARANRARQASELWVYTAPAYSITTPIGSGR